MRNSFARRGAALLCACALVFAACGDDDPQTAAEGGGTDTSSPATTENASGGHSHDMPFEATAPAPTVRLDVVADPKAGFNVHVRTTDFTFTPEKVNESETVSGEGHAHLYLDGEKVARLYGPWYHLDAPLQPGEHEVRVELNANDHRPYAADGEPIEATTTIVVGDGESDAADDPMPDSTPDEEGMVIDVQVDSGEVAGGGRHAVELGSTVTIRVTSDVADHVHLHGYDVLVDVAAGETAELTFDATIPGVFEAELEDARIPLLELEVS